ncbi:MAG: hypothetical protein M3O32_03430 [Actinomycetota bacterium]|nr:hypothetical protein [Actinomycetota bacterium]
MSLFRLSRRATVLGAASALVLGCGTVALLTPASASSACPTYTDPAGDAYFESTNFPANPGFPSSPLPVSDPNLDILAVTHSTDNGLFTTVLKLKALSATTTGGVGTGDEFKVLFTVAGKAVVLDLLRDGTMAPPLTLIPSMTVGGTASTVVPTVTIDEKGATVTFAVKVDDFAKAIGAPVMGQAFSAMSTKADTNFLGQSQTSFIYDLATAPATASYHFGDSCGGGSSAPAAGPTSAAPAPSGSATPAPSGSVSPTPSTSASPTASGSASPAPSGSATPAPSGSATPAPSGSATPTPAPTGSTPAGPSGQLDFPRKGCADITDPAGDANPALLGVVPLGADPDLDITSVNFRTSPTTLQAYLRVPGLSATGPSFPLATGHQFDAAFTVNKKVVDLSAQSATVASGSIGGTASPALKVTGSFDTKKGFVILTVDRASLAAATGAAVPDGTVLTATSASSQQLNDPLPPSPADTAQAATAAAQVYTVGNVACFLPPAAKISIDADKSVQYSDNTVAYATVTDADNQPLGKVTIIGQLGTGRAVQAVTDAEGIAQLTIPAMAKTGPAQLFVGFAGNSVAGPASATRPITVTIEPTVLKATGGRGTVNVALRDDDRAPVAGQPVVFTVGGKGKTVKTNGRGLASLRGIPAGSSVTVSYVGSKGYYAAATSVRTKA